MSEITVLIKHKSPLDASRIESLEASGAVIKHIVESINSVVAKVPAEYIDKLKSDPDIEYIEVDNVAEAQVIDYQTDNKTVYSAAGQVVPWGISKIRSPDVWKDGNRGEGINWAVIDTGVNRSHPDLAANIKGGYNFITKSDNFEDDNGHGTHVSGTIAAIDNDIGVIGVAPAVGIYALKVLDKNGSGSYLDIIAAIDWCINNPIHGINMSLGGSSPNQGLRDVCAAAYKANIIIVAAAGNSGGDGTVDTVLYPAKYSESVIAAAATDINDVRAVFSSCGTEVEDAGPGVSVWSTVPTANAKYSDPSGYKELSGTSMATPHISGTCALILKAHPEFKPADIRNALDKGAVDLGPPGKDVFYGNGRIDAKSSVDLTPPTPPTPPVLTKITVSPSNATVYFGTSQQFIATAFDQNNNPMASVSISWTIDNPLGTITPQNGVTGADGTVSTTFVAGSSAGNATITASSGNISNSSSVVVTEQPVTPVLTKILLEPPSVTLNMGGTQVFKATAIDQNNRPMPNITISWLVAQNPAVGKVNPIYSYTNPEGVATTTFVAVNSGSCVISASSRKVFVLSNVTVNSSPPVPGKKFKVMPLGISGHYIGVTVLNLPHGGDKTADEACKEVCDLLKQM